jgi:HEAT repeat protein
VQHEQALQALGTASHDAAVELLAEELEHASLAEGRQRVIEALGLSLRPRARSLLIELVQSERSSDAEAALAALAIHRYDDKLVAQLRTLSEASRPLARRFAELFSA